MGLDVIVDLFRKESPYQLRAKLQRAQREAETAALAAKREKERAYAQVKEAVRTNAPDKTVEIWATTYDRSGKMETAAYNIKNYVVSTENMMRIGEQYFRLLGLTKDVAKATKKLTSKTGNVDKIAGEAEEAFQVFNQNTEQIGNALEGLSRIGQSEPTEDLVAKLRAQATAEIAQETIGVADTEREIAAERAKDQGKQQ